MPPHRPLVVMSPPSSSLTKVLSKCHPCLSGQKPVITCAPPAAPQTAPVESVEKTPSPVAAVTRVAGEPGDAMKFGAGAPGIGPQALRLISGLPLAARTTP